MRTKKSTKFLVSGPYGSGNLGDDAIAHAVCTQLQQRQGSVTLAAIDTEAVAANVPNVPAVERLNVRGLRFSVIKAISSSDVVVIGGGEQFSEPRIANPIWGHLATNVQLFVLAKVLRKKYAAIGVGVDHGISFFGKLALKLAVKGADFVSVRDIASYERLAKLTDASRIFLGADPVFLMDALPKDECRRKLEERYRIPTGAKVVLVMPSIDKFHSLDYLDRLSEVVKESERKGYYVLYAISDSQSGYDIEIFRKALLRTSDRVFWARPGKASLAEIIELICGVDCLVSSRMHPVIFSLAQNTPFVCLARSAKMHALMAMLGNKSYLDLDFSVASLMAMIDENLSLSGGQLFSEHKELLKLRAAEQFDKLLSAI